MKVFENKSLFKKILIVMLFVIVASFVFSGQVRADDGIGGKLLNPIVDLLVFLGDGIMNIIHGVIYGHYETTIVVPLISTIGEIILTGLLAIVIGALVAVALVLASTAVVAALAAKGITIATIGIGTVLMVSAGTGVAGAALFNSNVLPDELYLPVYQITPEKIFSNEVPVFDVDFFNPKDPVPAKDPQGNIIYNDNGNIVYMESTAEKLRNTVSTWYNILRDIAIVALLSILVYVGIRIVISSTAGDKAKYKQMIMDWIVAICLLFFMQYIMSFSNLLVGKLTSFVSGLKYDSGYVGLVEDKDGKVSKKLNDLGYNVDRLKTDIEGKTFINWNTSLTGLSRLNAQMAKSQNTTYAGYALVFVVLVLYTCYFIFTYLKRVLYMAFLTIIAPFVAMTYPIDKINDGKAQAFNMWFKEYIFNLLIQPMHLILYSILISSAFELASENIIYSLVAIGFMIPAEKLLRKFFGFEKAQTPGFLGGAAGAGLTMAAMNKLLSKGGSGGKGGGSDKSSQKDSLDTGKPPRINENFKKQDAMLGSGSDSSSKSNNNDDNNKDDSQNTTDVLDNKQDNNEDNNEDNNYQELESDPYQDYLDELSNVYSNGSRDNELDDPSLYDSNYMFMHPEEYDDDGNYIGPQEIGTDSLGNEDDFLKEGENTPIIQQDVPDDIDSEDEDEQDENTSKNTFGKNFKNNMKSYGMASRYYAKGLKDKAANRIKNANPAKAALRTIGGAATGALAGGIGLAAGIAAGDPSKALQYGGGAALGGYKLGSGKVSKMQQDLHVDGIEEIQERGAYETEQEYIEAKQKEYVKEFQKNRENQFKLEKKYGKKEAKRIMKDVVPECLDKGIYKMDDIMTINDMVENKHVENLNMGIATAKYASMVGSEPKKMTSKKYKEWHDTFSDGWAKNSKIKQLNKDPKEQATLDLDRIQKFYDIKSKL